MADPRGFLTVRQREEVPSRPVPVRLLDWKEVHEHRVFHADAAPHCYHRQEYCSYCYYYL